MNNQSIILPVFFERDILINLLSENVLIKASRIESFFANLTVQLENLTNSDRLDYENLYSSLIQKDPFEQGNIFGGPVPFEPSYFEAAPIDGIGNNQQNIYWGAADSNLLNIAPLAYKDGFSTPADRPQNPRHISNVVSEQKENMPESRGLTNFIWAWGQFLDHDISLTPEASEKDAGIIVPPDDSFFPKGTKIPLFDTLFVKGTGTDPYNPRQLPNKITAFIDGSNVYGSSEERAKFLRTFFGGKLKTSKGNLLPYNDGTIKENDNPTGQDPTSLFVAGDVRSNENSVLTSIHTLFVREHNRIAKQLAQVHPYWTDEQLFQRARQINVAQMQSITYNEYLPTLLGKTLPEYRGYNPLVNPGISRTFSTAAFRLGHTQLSSKILRLDHKGNVIPEGNLTLADAFFPRGEGLAKTGIASILRGIASSLSQKIDTKVIDDVRNLLFGGGPNAIGRDLAAINIQRGRINGLSDYNTIRKAFGLWRVNSFAEITSDLELQDKLRQLYGSVDKIDPWIGMLAEDHLPGSSVGETLKTVLTDQFLRLRDGDRFYYENLLTAKEIEAIESTKLSHIIRRNTDTKIIQDNVFSLVNNGTSRNDILQGGLGDDTLNGKRGDDILLGYQGADLLQGQGGNDILNGGEGNDTLLGGQGIDILQGGAGNDILNGQRDDDILVGGDGADVFQFGGKNLQFRDLGVDQIIDFTPEDTISLSKDTFGEFLTFAEVNNVADALNAEALIVYDRSSGSLFYNSDGNIVGFGSGGQFAKLAPELTISVDNFTIA
ncbi:MAG: peroxidase family protein [Prochloraceae cyanobacterium]